MKIINRQMKLGSNEFEVDMGFIERVRGILTGKIRFNIYIDDIISEKSTKEKGNETSKKMNNELKRLIAEKSANQKQEVEKNGR